MAAPVYVGRYFRMSWARVAAAAPDSAPPGLLPKISTAQKLAPFIAEGRGAGAESTSEVFGKNREEIAENRGNCGNFRKTVEIWGEL